MAFEAPFMQKKSFIRSGEGALASYDWIDVAEGTGIQKFTGVVYANGAATPGDAISGGILTKASQINVTKQVFISGAALATSGWTKDPEIDFDLAKFNSPRIIKGTGYIMALFHQRDTGTAPPDGGDTSGQLVIHVKKVDSASAETILVTQSGAIVHAVNTHSFDTPELLKIDFPNTHFKIGETLRVTAELWSESDTNGVRQMALYINPTETDLSGAFKVLVPFKIDI